MASGASSASSKVRWLPYDMPFFFLSDSRLKFHRVGALTEFLAHRYVTQCFVGDDQTLRISIPHDILVLVGMVKHGS